MKGFIKVHIVTQRPGNPVSEGYVRAESIKFFHVAHEEVARIGGATNIEDGTGAFYVTESIEEVMDLIKAERD